WFKFGEYYKMTEESPAYAAAILLHPSLRKACLQNSDSWKKADINRAIREVRKLWKDHFKPASEQHSAQDKPETPYERWKRERYLNIGVSSTIGDDFERFITATPYSIGEQSPLEYWLEPTQQKTYPELSLMAITI
ncbi:hypothetical protein K469DRAFT_536578, partial [Zopfia rhizophila CBS 207.26]